MIDKTSVGVSLSNIVKIHVELVKFRVGFLTSRRTDAGIYVICNYIVFGFLVDCM